MKSNIFIRVCFAFVIIAVAAVSFMPVGCTVGNPPSARPSAGQAVGTRGHYIKVKAAGLAPILKDFFPKLKGAVNGDYVQIVPGIEAFVSDVDVTVSETDDGRVQFSFGGGQKIKIDKTALGFIPIRATETVGSVTLDATGADVELRDSIVAGVRLEASP